MRWRFEDLPRPSEPRGFPIFFQDVPPPRSRELRPNAEDDIRVQKYGPAIECFQSLSPDILLDIHLSEDSDLETGDGNREKRRDDLRPPSKNRVEIPRSLESTRRSRIVATVRGGERSRRQDSLKANLPEAVRHPPIVLWNGKIERPFGWWSRDEKRLYCVEGDAFLFEESNGSLGRRIDRRLGFRDLGREKVDRFLAPVPFGAKAHFFRFNGSDDWRPGEGSPGRELLQLLRRLIRLALRVLLLEVVETAEGRGPGAVALVFSARRPQVPADDPQPGGQEHGREREDDDAPELHGFLLYAGPRRPRGQDLVGLPDLEGRDVRAVP